MNRNGIPTRVLGVHEGTSTVCNFGFGEGKTLVTSRVGVGSSEREALLDDYVGLLCIDEGDGKTPRERVFTAILLARRVISYLYQIACS